MTKGDLPSQIGIHTIGFFAVCVPCKVGLPSKRRVSEHLTNRHSVDISTAKDRSEAVWEKKVSMESSMPLSLVWEKYPKGPRCTSKGSTADLEAIPVNETQFYTPLFGLDTADGYKCSFCTACYTEVRSLSTHLAGFHDVKDVRPVLEQVQQLGKVKLQTIFGGRARCWFPVTDIKPLGDVEVAASNEHIHDGPLAAKGVRITTMDVDAVTQQNLGDVARNVMSSVQEVYQTSEDATHIDLKLKNTFVAMSRVDEVLQSRNISFVTAFELSGMKSEDESLWNIVLQDVMQYFRLLPKITIDIPTCIMKLINIRSRGNHQYEFKPVGEKSSKNYAIEICRLVMFCVRCQTNNDHLCGESVSGLVSMYLGETDRAKENNSWKQRYEGFHLLIRGLLLHSHPLLHSSESLTVKNFFACSCVREHVADILNPSEGKCYRLSEAWEVSKPLAALQYGIAACAVHEVYILQKNCAEPGYGVLPEDLEDQLKRVTEAIDLEKNNPASFVRSMLDLVMSIIDQEDIDVTFEACDTHLMCGIIKDVHLSMAHLGGLVKDAHKSLDVLIFRKLLLGAELPNGFLNMVKSLQNDLNNKCPGYNFMAYNRKQKNWVQENVKFALQTNCSPSGLIRLSGPGPTSSQIRSTAKPRTVDVFGCRMLRSRVVEWLSLCREVQELLLFCIHVSSGSPARATELATLRLSNDTHGMRNLYVSQFRAMIVTKWVKTREMKGFSKPIPRFPDSKTSFFLLSYLCMIRPLETAIISALYGQASANDHWSFLFCNKWKPFPEQTIRGLIPKRIVLHGVRSNFNDFRNFTVGMVPFVSEQKALTLVEEIGKEVRGIGHLQAGHSVATAERAYARTREEITRLQKTGLAAFRAWSAQWHGSLLLSQKIKKRTQDGERFHRRELSKRTKATPITISKPDSKISAGEVHQGRAQHSTPSEQQKESQSPNRRSQKDAFVMDSDIVIQYGARTEREEDSRSNFSTHRDVRLNDETHRSYEPVLPEFLLNLRAMVSLTDASFRSMLQFNATAFVSERRENALLIMPTGSGKSICFLLPIYTERRCLSTILIVPLRSLLHEMTHRALEHGLHVSTTLQSPLSSDYADLYIILPEHVRFRSFKQLVQRLISDRRLARVVVDEAHPTSFWSSFRQSLRDLRYGLLEIPPKIPRVLLTATVPPCDRHALVSKHGLATASVFSMETVRKNLEYSVVFADTRDNVNRSTIGRFQNHHKNLMSCAVTTIEAKLNEICSSFPKTSTFRVLVYVMRRAEVETVADVLSAIYDSHVSDCDEPHYIKHKSVSVLAYHAGMSKEKQEKMHKDWKCPPIHQPKINTSNLTHHITLMVCTCAFGAGLDAPDVRLVVHVGGSTSLVDHAQESGRAGRDGQSSYCVTIYSFAFAAYVESVLENRAAETKDEKDFVAAEMWRQVVKWIENTSSCRKNQLYRYIDGWEPGICLLDVNSLNCDICSRLEKKTGDVKASTDSQFRKQDFELRSRSPEVKTTSKVGDTRNNMILPPTHDSSGECPSVLAKELSSLDSVLDICESVLESFEGDCLACFIAHGRLGTFKGRCSGPTCMWSRGRCFQCYSRNHRVGACPNKLYVPQGGCFKCGLSFSRGQQVQREGLGFASSCKLGNLRDIGCFLWRTSEDTWKRMVHDPFSDEESCTFFGSQGSSIPSNASSVRSQDTVFAEWLKSNKVGTPSLLRLGVWYQMMQRHLYS